MGRGWGGQFVQLSAEEKEVIGLSTIRVGHQVVRAPLRTMGTVYAPPARMAILGYPFPARVARVRVHIGDWVTEGQALVDLQADEVATTKALYQQARTALELAESSHAREQRLVERGVGARKALLAAENELKRAHAAVEAAAKRLHVLGVSETGVEAVRAAGDVDPLVTLFAPITGKIINTTPVLGAMVDQGTTILTILDPRVLCVDAEVYERDLAKLRTGQEVTVTVPAHPDETFSGRIGYIGDVVKAETRTVTVRSEIDNRAGRLKPGMFADVRLFLDEEASVLALPERAVLDDGGEQLVFVATDRGYVPQLVQVGTREAGYVEIVRGVSSGDEVVLDGNFQLKSKLFEEVLEHTP
jgi:cobalt-zinc-cadmium efflux system membrane fusion protein